MSLSRVGLSTLRGVRRVATSSAPVDPGYKKLDEVKDRFNLDDGVPIYVKNGPTDRILYGLTMIACIGAVGYSCKKYYDLSLR